MLPRPSRRRTLFIISLVTGLLLSVSPAAMTQASSSVIVRGDHLQITVWGYPEFSTTATVRDDGAVSIPLVGDVQAAGSNREEFIASLKRALAEYIQGEIKVTVSVGGSSVVQYVTVLGAVTKPDRYPINETLRFLEILSMAGGYVENADIGSIRIFHRDKSVLTTEVDLDLAIERGSLETLPTLRADDVVFIPFRENLFKEIGEYFGYAALLFAIVRIAED